MRTTVTGNLYVVHYGESGIDEYTPDGRFVQRHALPPRITGVEGVAVDCSRNEAWVNALGGMVYHLGGVP